MAFALLLMSGFMLLAVPIFSVIEGLPPNPFWFISAFKKKTSQPEIRVSVPRFFETEEAGVLESPLFPAPLDVTTAIACRCGVVTSASDPRDVSKCRGVLLFTRGGLVFFPDTRDDDDELAGWMTTQAVKLALSSPAEVVSDVIKDGIKGLVEKAASGEVDIAGWMNTSMSRPDYFICPWIYLVEVATSKRGQAIITCQAPGKAAQSLKIEDAGYRLPALFMKFRYYRELELSLEKLKTEQAALLLPAVLSELSANMNHQSEQELQSAGQAEARRRTEYWFEQLTGSALNNHLHPLQSRYDDIPELAQGYPELFGPKKVPHELLKLAIYLTSPS